MGELSNLNKNDNDMKMMVEKKLTIQSIMTIIIMGRKSSITKPVFSARPFFIV